MNNSKTVKKSVAVITAVAVAAIMAATSVICVALASDRSLGSGTYSENAKSVVAEFVNNESYNKYAYMDGLFAKANIVSACVSEQTDADLCNEISKNLGLNSFIVTDSEGRIISSTDADRLGKSIIDDESTKQFKTVLKGNTYKKTSEPAPIEGESGVYNVMACVTRSAGGIVIIDINTDSYTSVTGENLADSCKGDTIIAKDGKIISSNLETDGASELADLGITDEMLGKESFTITVEDKSYTLSAENVEGYTVISGTVSEENGFNYIYGAVIPAVTFAVMSALAIVVFTVAGRKK